MGILVSMPSCVLGVRDDAWGWDCNAVRDSSFKITSYANCSPATQSTYCVPNLVNKVLSCSCNSFVVLFVSFCFVFFGGGGLHWSCPAVLKDQS